MSMLWIYSLIAIWLFILSYLLLRVFAVKRITASLSTLILIAIIIGLAHVYIEPSYLAWQHERNLRHQYPFIAYLSEKTPENFNKYMAQIRVNIQSHHDLNNEIVYQSELLNTLLLKYAPQASDAALYRYLKFNVDYDKKLIAIDPTYVLYHEFPDKFTNTTIDFSKLNRDEYIHANFDAVSSVLQSGIETPQALPTDDEQKKMMGLFRQIVETLSQQYGEEVVIATLQDPNNPTLDSSTSAKITISFFEAILAQGESTAGLFMRVAFFISRPE